MASGPEGPPIPEWHSLEGWGSCPAGTAANLPAQEVHPSSDLTLSESCPTHPCQGDRAQVPLHSFW